MSTNEPELVKVGFWGADGSVERVWAAPVGPNLYRLDNAPAFAFGVALYDVVEVHLDDDGNRWVLRVVEPGGIFTVRVLLDEKCPRSVRLLKMLDRLGCSYERMDPILFAVFVENEAIFQQLIEELASGGYRWEYVNPKRADVANPHPSASAERLGLPEVDVAEQALLHHEATWMGRADDELETLAEVNSVRQRTELLPARRIDGKQWELCCTPFLAGFALGDVVEADAELRVLRRASRSGRGSLFAYVEDAGDLERAKATLESLGCLVEQRWGTGTIGIDCATPRSFDQAREWLATRAELVFDVLQPPRRDGDHDPA